MFKRKKTQENPDKVMDMYVSVGKKNGYYSKAGYLHVSREASINPMHPDHEETMRAIGSIASAGIDYGMDKSEAVWAGSYDMETQESLETNPHLEEIASIVP